MTNAPQIAAPSVRSANVGRFIVFAAVVLTLGRVLFPPFTSLYGTEYAFVMSGPEWARAVSGTGADIGLNARIYWAALAVQLGALWAIAIGGRWLLGTPTPAPTWMDRLPRAWRRSGR